MTRTTLRLQHVLMAIAAIMAVTGCAPDAMTRKPAPEFNAYLDQIAVACKPLMLGRYDMSYRLQQKDMYDDDANYFMDLTSRLFYQAVTPEAYESGINGFFGGGATTNRSIDCIIVNLPANRPRAGPQLIKVN